MDASSTHHSTGESDCQKMSKEQDLLHHLALECPLR
jgi:hypothetical protein